MKGVTDTDLPAIILYVVLAVVAIVVAIPVIIFTVRVKVGIEFKDEFRFWVSFLGIRYTILPKKPKKYNIRDYTPAKIAKRDRKAAEKAAKKAEAEAKKKAERAAKKRKKKALGNKLTVKQQRQQFREKLSKWPAIDDASDLFFMVIRTFFTTFIGHFHFHFTRIRIAVGSDNAAKTALLTTTIASTINPVLYVLEQHSNLHVSKNADICVYPDYLAEDIKFDVKLAFSMSLGAFLWTLIKTAVPGIIGWTKIQPESKQTVSNGHKNQTSSASRIKTATNGTGGKQTPSQKGQKN